MYKRSYRGDPNAPLQMCHPSFPFCRRILRWANVRSGCSIKVSAASFPPPPAGKSKGRGRGDREAGPHLPSNKPATWLTFHLSSLPGQRGACPDREEPARSPRGPAGHRSSTELVARFTSAKLKIKAVANSFLSKLN